MEESEGLPLEWNVEAELLEQGKLVAGWRDVYWRWVHPCAVGSVKEKVCEDYVYGCQWVIDYYTGKSVNRSWMFPSWIPPLWSDLAAWLSKAEGMPSDKGGDVEIQPAEQLAMVLPLESWGLIRDKRLRRLPALAPQMWPAKFDFFSLGRKWLWECEARVPVLTAVRLRELLKEVS
jgi:5'-3' exonuclease